MAENIVTYKVQVDVQSGKIAIDGLTNGFVKAETAVKRLNKEVQNTTTKGLNPMIDKTGLAGATVVELGRTISDSNYGIRGMANNLSQLATLMTTLIVTTKGLGNGLRALWSALMGPLGLIVVFQTVIAVIESFAIKNQGASKATKELTDSISEETEALEALINVKGDANGLLEKELELRKTELALKAANKKLVDVEIAQADKRKKLEEELFNFKKSLQELDEQALEYRREGNDLDALMIEEGKRKIILNKLISENTKELNELNEERNRLDNEYLSILEKSNQQELERRLNAPKTISLYKEYIKRLKDFQQNSATTAEEFQAAAKAIVYWQNKITEIAGSEKGIDKLTDFLNKWRQKRLESEAATKQEVLELQRTASLQEAKELKAGKEVIREINLYYDSEIHKSKRVVQKALELTTKKFYKQDIETFEQYIERRRRIEKNAKKADEYLANEAEKKRQERLNNQIAVAQAVGAAVSGIADNIDAAYQKEIDIEQNKTTALNNQLRERLANEQLSADQRRSIQDQIAKNDEALRIKQEAIEKKRFKANKSAAIAEATISTFVAAAGVLKDTEGGSVARIAGMIAVIGAGLAQVAMISKQQFVSSQSSIGAGAGTGSSGGNQVQAPDFNVVGQSGSNQLAEAVKGQLSQPIKTYVVSKDVSTAQEMERNIIGSASLG
jgi:hypothetical protein